jgi:hypothetical protein
VSELFTSLTIDVGYHHRRTFFGEPGGYGTSHPGTGASGDDRDLTI